jgi:hypothetical protein
MSSSAAGAPLPIAAPIALATPAQAPVVQDNPALPVRRNELQDELADAVRRFQDSRQAVPENIKPGYPGVQAR